MLQVIEEIRAHENCIRPYLTDEPPTLETTAIPVRPLSLSLNPYFYFNRIFYSPLNRAQYPQLSFSKLPCWNYNYHPLYNLRLRIRESNLDGS